jgi:predicted phage terminase large subunit-like protein
MAQRPSQGKSRRQRLDAASAQIRAAFGINPEVVALQKSDPRELLAQAWEMAAEIADFAVKYLGHFMIDPKSGEFTAPAEFHKEVYRILLSEQYAAIAAPREHAKSTVVSVIFPLFCICYKKRRFIVLISDTQPQAALQLAAIKEELETNEELRKDFGDLVGDKKWDVNDCRTSTGITMCARGAGQRLRGLRYRMWRPDLVICDDLENEEGVENPETREKLVRWFKGTVMNLGKYCQIFVVGTILHYDSFLSELLDESKFKRFVKRRYMAVDTDWTPESVLWPAKWDLESLKVKEEDLGSVFFNQEFRNLPISSETQVFQENWIKQHQYFRDQITFLALVKITYHDPAISLKRKADYFGSITVGVRDNGKILVLRSEQKKMPFTQQVDYIIRLWDEEQPEVVGIEDQAYQEALKQTIDEISTTTGRYMNVVGVSHLTDKFMRIARISSLVENGTIQFCLDGTQQALINQLLFLGKIKDDLADALESAVALAREMNFRPAMAMAGAAAGVGERQPQQARGMLSQMFIQRAMRSQQRGATAAPGEFVQRGRSSVWQTRR